MGILFGYYMTTTKRFMGKEANTYDVGASYPNKRDMIPCSTEHQGIMDTKGIINGSLMCT